MNAVEWNKKEELVADQAIKHIKIYCPLLAAVAKSGKAELTLMVKIQEYCYGNVNFMKSFQKIIVMLYKSKKKIFLELPFCEICSNPHCTQWSCSKYVCFFCLLVCKIFIFCIFLRAGWSKDNIFLSFPTSLVNGHSKQTFLT